MLVYQRVIQQINGADIPLGWWLLLTPLKNDGVSNSWDDDIPN